MIMTTLFKKHRFLSFTCLAAIAFAMSIFFSPVAMAKLFDGPVDRLPVLERVSLREGKVTLLGQKGEYTCRVLANASVESAWKVLTDYNNFSQFLPGVEASKLVESKGDRKVFEQTNKIKTFIFSTEAEVKIAVTEYYPQKIAFKAVDGDLETMNGEWLIEAVSPYPSAPPDKVLITHTVYVEPAGVPSKDMFYGIYEDSLENTLAAIKVESEKRSTQTQ
ncbi:MAG: hypothetical protein Tsb0014_32220 [Pleurocapsa sp.]